MARPEPFRALLDEAYEAEGKKAPAAPVPLERRLDQVLLAGVTPAHGLRVPASVRALRQEAPLSSPSAPPVEASDSTRALLDALDADITSPSHKPRPVSSLSPKHDLKSAPADVPAPMNFPRPPPLPKKGPALKAAAPAPVVVPPVREADRAPPPRISALLDDTHPALRDPSSSSSSGKIADLYRLQLEFEDTPARPLPRNASLPPLPVDDRVTQPMPADAMRALARANRRSFELSAPSALSDELEPHLAGEHRLEDQHLMDEDGIADLDALARAMGLRGIGDVSIPSMDGAPVADDASLDDIPTLATGPLSDGTRPSDEARRQRVMEALGEGKESVFVSKEGDAVADTRPALQPASSTTPVIVKIPARPRVSAENRERARRLYLTAVDALAKADRVGAIGQLRLAMEIDDGNPLYPELLRQLEKQMAERAAGAPKQKPRSAEGPALMVATTSGSLRRPQEFVRFRE